MISSRFCQLKVGSGFGLAAGLGGGAALAPLFLASFFGALSFFGAIAGTIRLQVPAAATAP